MTCKGIVKGKTTELDQAIPSLEGQPVSVTVEPAGKDFMPGSPAAIQAVLASMPDLDPEIIDEFERGIEEGKHPVRHIWTR